ncbi:MAG: tetratricopeptide repeat protein [Anaerolineae bacterium]
MRAADGDPSPPVIVTKVRPPRRRRDLLSRSRLIDYVSDNIDRKLLLVSAPAGYGKTSLLIDFVHASDFPVSWYRLDSGDSDPVVFFEHLLTAIEQTYPDACQRTRAALQSEEKVDVESIVGSLVNEIDEKIPDFFLLVLDDYQNIDDSLPVNRAVDTLLHYLPLNVQLIISSRSLPTKLTLTRLAGEGQVAGVGQEQLRFTPLEIQSLVEQLHGKLLSEMECERLARESEGWITALVLGSERLLDGIRIGLARPAADKVRLFDFLAKEVYSDLPDHVRAFLTQSAVLEELSPSLCDFVLDRDDSADMLSWVEEHNLFVSRIEGEGDWHRYHQLFHDFLLDRLAEATSPDAISLLHHRAADWYDAVGQPAVAIRHLLASGDHGAAADRINGEVAAAHAQGRWQTVVRWADSLPEEELAAYPSILVHLGMAHSYVGDVAAAFKAFESAQGIYVRRGDTEGEAAVLVSRAPVWRIVGSLDNAASDSRRALELAVDPNGLTAGLAHRSLGASLVQRGDMAAAAEELQRALACFESHGAIASAAHAQSDLSATYQLSGEIERAIHHSRAACELWEQLGNFGALALALNNMATAYHQQGRFEEARHWLLEAVEKARLAGVRRVEAMALISLGDVLADLNDFVVAHEHYQRGLELAQVVGDRALVCYGLAAQGEALRLDGDLRRARNAVAEARAALAEHRTAYESALVDYVRGTLALDSAEFVQSMEHLEDAARAFGQMGARREEARALLYRSGVARRAGDDDDAQRWLERAEDAVRAFGYRASFEPYLRRVQELTPVEGLDDGERFATARRSKPERLRRPIQVDVSGGKLVVRALGRPMVLVDGRSIQRQQWQTLTARDLFFLLVDRPGGMTRQELMAAFWPESMEVRARSSLHSTLYRIRRALADKQIVESDFERYFVARSDDLFYDVAELEARLARASAAPSDEERAGELEAAINLVRGEYMEGVLDDWCAARRTEIENRVTDALLSLAETRARLTKWPEAVDAYQRVLGRDRLREDAHRGLMGAYAASGDRTRALRQFEVFERLLQVELATRPAGETRELYETIRSEEQLGG